MNKILERIAKLDAEYARFSKDRIEEYVSSGTVEPIAKLLGGISLTNRVVTASFKGLSFASPIVVGAKFDDNLAFGVEILQDVYDRVTMKDSSGNEYNLRGDIDAGLFSLYVNALNDSHRKGSLEITLYSHPRLYVSDTLDHRDESFTLHVMHKVKKSSDLPKIVEYLRDDIEEKHDHDGPRGCERQSCNCKTVCPQAKGSGRKCNFFRQTCHGCCEA